MTIPATNIETPNEIKRDNLDQFQARQAKKGKAGKLFQWQQVLLVIFESGIPLTRKQIARAMSERWPGQYEFPPINCVCPRLQELTDRDLVETMGTFTDPVSGISSHLVACTDEGVRVANEVKHKDAQIEYQLAG